MNEIKKEKIVQFFRQMLEVYDFELVSRSTALW